MSRLWSIVSVVVVLAALSASGSAQSLPQNGAERGGADAAESLAPTEDRGVISGRVVDATTGEPLPGAAVRLRELGRGQATREDGTFRFERLPARAHTVAAQFIGYAPQEQRVQLPAGGTIHVEFALESTALELPGVVVTGMGRERGVADTYRPTAVLDGRELQRSLEPSLAETLRRIPGLHAVYNGPAASRPTIRGMGGDRVLVLEDGQRTGDMSTTAADHAVALDAISAERIEVVRGPAGLLYGSNALGGVINVLREEVPRSLPLDVTGTVTTSLQSMNDGVGGHALVLAPAGPIALRAEISGRQAGDTRTPEGVLPSSDLENLSLSAGGSAVGSWGFVGGSYRYFGSNYSVPGTFNGEIIPGAHPDGVEIEMRRQVGRLQAAHLLGIGPFSAVELEANVTHYQHDEIEARNDEGGAILGARFDQLSGGVSLTGRHSHDLEAFTTEGAVGLAVRGRDLVAAGGFTGTRSATEYALAAYAFEEFQLNRLRLQLGARYDFSSVSPLSNAPIVVGDRSIPVEGRSFGNLSASAGLLYALRPGWTVGLTMARAFRSPSIEELYSDGPHLADYSYDIGNPELASEIGHGVDLFVRSTQRRLSLEAGVFANRVSNFVYYRPTGELDPRFRRFPVFAATSDDALFTGFDGRIQWQVISSFILDVTAGYVRATRIGDGDPLPAIPPFSANVEARFERRGFFVALGFDAAAAQERVPAANSSSQSAPDLNQVEQPTSGYGLLNASAGIRLDHAGLLHSITLQGRNLTDAVWRDHLSRIKDVAPQPGRDVQLTYRVQF
jgi:iron complex outermembrane recepter protein